MDASQASPGVDAPELKKVDGGRVLLNSADVVDRIIREFTTEIIGLIGQDDFMARLDFECRRLNGLFLGLTPSDTYQRGPWNAPEQLGEYMLKALRINGTSRLAVRDAFAWYVDKLLDTIGTGSEFDEAKVAPLIGELRNALLGRSGASLDCAKDDD